MGVRIAEINWILALVPHRLYRGPVSCGTDSARVEPRTIPYFQTMPCPNVSPSCCMYFSPQVTGGPIPSLQISIRMCSYFYRLRCFRCSGVQDLQYHVDNRGVWAPAVLVEISFAEQDACEQLVSTASLLDLLSAGIVPSKCTKSRELRVLLFAVICDTAAETAL